MHDQYSLSFQNSDNLRTGFIIFLCLFLGLPLGLLKDVRMLSKTSTACIMFYSFFSFYVSICLCPLKMQKILKKYPLTHIYKCLMYIVLVKMWTSFLYNYRHVICHDKLPTESLCCVPTESLYCVFEQDILSAVSTGSTPEDPFQHD